MEAKNHRREGGKNGEEEKGEEIRMNMREEKEKEWEKGNREKCEEGKAKREEGTWL